LYSRKAYSAIQSREKPEFSRSYERQPVLLAQALLLCLKNVGY
jgi:hypothetical protein